MSGQPAKVKCHFGTCSLGHRSISVCSADPRWLTLGIFFSLPFLFPCELQVCFKSHYFPCSSIPSGPMGENEIKETGAMYMQIIETGIHRERLLFQENLIECHYQASCKTTQSRSGFPGLASKTLLFTKNKKEPTLLSLSDLPIFEIPATYWESCGFQDTDPVLVSEMGCPRKHKTMSQSITRRQAHLPRQGCCLLALPFCRVSINKQPKWHIWKMRDTWIPNLLVKRRTAHNAHDAQGQASAMYLVPHLKVQEEVNRREVGSWIEWRILGLLCGAPRGGES